MIDTMARGRRRRQRPFATVTVEAHDLAPHFVPWTSHTGQDALLHQWYGALSHSDRTYAFDTAKRLQTHPAADALRGNESSAKRLFAYAVAKMDAELAAAAAAAVNGADEADHELDHHIAAFMIPALVDAMGLPPFSFWTDHCGDTLECLAPLYQQRYQRLAGAVRTQTCLSGPGMANIVAQFLAIRRLPQRPAAPVRGPMAHR